MKIRQLVPVAEFDAEEFPSDCVTERVVVGDLGYVQVEQNVLEVEVAAHGLIMTFENGDVVSSDQEDFAGWRILP